MALEHAADGDRDRAGLLRDNNEHAVRGLAHADSRAVARAEVARQTLIAGKRQHAACSAHPSGTDDHGAVMQRAVLEENVLDQLGRRCCVHSRAGGDDLAETLLALEHDERTGLGPGHIRARGNGCNDHALYHIRVGIRNQHAAEVALADLLEQAAQLRLKNDHNGEYADAERVAQQPRDHGQTQEAGKQHDKHQNKNTLGQSCGAGILQQLHNTVNDIRHDEDIHHVDRRHCAELIKRTEKRTYHGPP